MKIASATAGTSRNSRLTASTSKKPAHQLPERPRSPPLPARSRSNRQATAQHLQFMSSAPLGRVTIDAKIVAKHQMPISRMTLRMGMDMMTALAVRVAAKVPTTWNAVSTHGFVIQADHVRGMERPEPSASLSLDRPEVIVRIVHRVFPWAPGSHLLKHARRVTGVH